MLCASESIMKPISFMKRILLLTVALTAVAAHGQGTFSFTYDQQSSTNQFAIASLGPFNNFQPYGQSFTPSLSSVGFVQLRFADLNVDGQGATVYVNLLENSITGNVLSSTSPVFMDDGFQGFTNFFFPSPVLVTSNTTYFFQPVLQSGDSTLNALEYFYNYAGGTAFHSGAPISDVDLWFREGIVAVPEPSTVSLFLCGAGALFIFRLKKKQKRASENA